MANVILEFIGQTNGAQVFRHPATKRNIRAGRNLAVRYVGVEEEEVNYFVSLGLFRVAHPTTPVTATPRKDKPARIEPVVQQHVPSNTEVPVDNTPEENIVSFEDNQVEQLVDWLSGDAIEAPAETTDNEISEVVDSNPNTVDEPKSDKVRRGRPRG